MLLLTCLLALGALSSAWASHFRYGSITWRTVQSDASKRTIEFKVSQAWRSSAFGNPTMNSRVSTDALSFGDGSSAGITLLVTSVDAAADNFYGETTITHTYATTGNFTASVNDCCRLGGLRNNSGGSFYQSTLVGVGSGNNSPVSSMPPIVNLAVGQAAATFQLAANDPDGDPLTYSLASSADMNNASVNPTGLSVNPTTGAVTFNTSSATIGSLYNAILKVSDGKTSILVDFLIQVTRVSVAPRFDYSVTPTNGYVYQVSPGTPVTFSVRATDSDAGDIVRLQALGIPPGAVMAPALPTTGNPVNSTFTWTPTMSTLGTSVVNFVAQDLLGVQSSTSVTIQVSTKPTFDTPPTPTAGSFVQVTPGTSISQLVRASSIDPNSPVRILSATGLPAAASFSPALPTAAANPTSTTLNWTPVVADWGLHTVMFTAANSYNDQKTHSFAYVVNSAPSFLSTPNSLNVVAGQPFHYNIITTDPDLPYGDELEIEHPVLPAWLTLTDNGDGTGSLDGTPTVAEAGANPVTLVAADTYHHGASYGLITQSFSINVIPCSAQALAHDVALTLDANGQAALTAAQVDNGSTATCGIASLTVAPNAFTCANLGANPVTLTLTDSYGNVSTATAIVTVTDATPPTITAPAAVTVSTDAGQCSASGVALGTAVAADNCSATVTNDAPATFAKGSTTVTWTATDASGNTATATQTVTVNDTELPTISAPAAVAVSTDAGQCSATGVVLGTAAAGDNCTGVVVTNDAPATFAKGTTTVTWTATDDAGNVATATQAVTVNDTEKPTIVAPAAVVVSTNAGQCSATNVALGSATAGDNCTGVVVSNNAPTTFTKGMTTVTWTATDAAGNTATATQTVTVNDTEKPVLMVPATIVANASASQCGAVVSFAPTATDNCAGATVVASPASGSTFPVGTSTVTVTATDASGNVSTGSFLVTVNDVTAPAVAVRNVTVALSNGAASVTAAQVNNGSTDACGIASVALSRTSFDCSNIGANSVTLTVTDIHGNVASAPAVVTVTGSIPTPTITAPANMYIGGRPTIYIGYGAQSLTLTAAGGVRYAWTPVAGLSTTSGASTVFTPSAQGLYTIAVTATSASGCTATTSIKVYVEDVRCGTPGNPTKVEVCHNGHTICIDNNALNTHLGHGDTVGDCTPFARPTTTTVITAAPLQAYPNPLTERTTITFRPEVSAPAQVRVFDAVGHQVATLFEGTTEAGRDYSLSLDASQLAAGIYLCRYESQGLVQIQRLSVVK
ncbi:hypothetical protein GCM10027594_11180 [Hymenobacter agri]